MLNNISEAYCFHHSQLSDMERLREQLELAMQERKRLQSSNASLRAQIGDAHLIFAYTTVLAGRPSL